MKPRQRILHPQELEPALIARARDADIDGMVALYESDAIIAISSSRHARGSREIKRYFADLLESGFVFHAGVQFPAIVKIEIALTSSRYPNGTMSSEVARRQIDGGWLWIIDYPSMM